MPDPNIELDIECEMMQRKEGHKEKGVSLSYNVGDTMNKTSIWQT